jgi:hypothetical protein
MPVRYVDGHQGRRYRLPIRYGKIDGEPVAYIPLTQGYWAIIDRGKLYLVKDGVWFYSNGYAVQARAGKKLKMQNVIMPPSDGKITDHRFGNRLDNRISQLRFAGNDENQRNQGIHKNNRSGYKGVSWALRAKRWLVVIGVDGKRIFIGTFSKDKIIEAAKAYDAAAIKYHGEYARLNFPKGKRCR